MYCTITSSSTAKLKRSRGHNELGAVQSKTPTERVRVITLLEIMAGLCVRDAVDFDGGDGEMTTMMVAGMARLLRWRCGRF
jgi:hypothetical protein